MVIGILYFLFATLFELMSCIEKHEPITILGIEPNSGPTTGETRVLVRLKNFNSSLIDDYPHPNCRFGRHIYTVNASYVKCTSKPRKVGDREPLPSEKNETCIQCENSVPHKEDIIPFTVSLLGDFTDTLNSIPFRYYIEPKITWIYPRYGPKDGGTFVEVYGENFLNFDQNLRCAFGSLEVKAYYVNEGYMICYSPKSAVVQKELPFSISLNNQQNTKEDVPYVYYEWPQVFRLEPNRGPDTGGTRVLIRGQNFNPMVELPNMNNFNDTFCRFGNLSLAQAVVKTSTEMECISPPSYEDREVPVEITLNNREWTDDGVLFHYYHPPFIYFINPKIGPVSGGTVVSITGSNFEDTGYVMCKFGDKHVKGMYINENELRCVAPSVEKPSTVGLYVAIRPDEFSSGINTQYRYYAKPRIDYIEPMCGPERGFTQITLYGANFPVGESEDVKCVFQRYFFMNATVMNDHEIKCDSPSVLNYMGVNENNITEYDVELTLNGVDIDGPANKFYYYKETFITGVTPIFGPVEGNTTVNITGFDFLQKGGCNVTARFATYQVKPTVIDHNYMIVASPQANYTGAVVVQVALNGRQFEKDITVNFRDQENTFYYYKFPLILEFKPEKGPTIGGTVIDILGVGFADPFYAVTDAELRKIYYRFIDCNDETIVHGEICETAVKESHIIHITSPRVYKNNTIACIQLSYNKENFVTIEDRTFTFFVLPNITSIEPEYGPLKSKDYQEVTVKLDNYYCAENCDQIMCQFKSKNNIFYEKGKYARPNQITCEVPDVNIPESFNLEASFNNGEDFTNNGFVYTFYDPYVVRVEPQMVSSKGKTKIKIYGYGFADSGKYLKVKFGSHESPLKCDYTSCIVQGEFKDQNYIEAETFPRSDVILEQTGEIMGYERFPVEVSVYNDDFTNNNVTIFYYDEPEIINDLNAFGVKMDPLIKKNISDVLVRSIPANLDTMILVPVNSDKIKKYYMQIDPFANYTCIFEMKNRNKTTYKITNGIFTSFPQQSDLNNIFLCQSPIWEEVGPARIKISLNGFDFSQTEFAITFTDPINLFKIEPPCGPLTGSTQVQLYGTGFSNSKEFVFKWGPQNLVPMSSNSFLNYVKASEISYLRKSKFKITKIIVKSPEAPNYLKTVGGLDYIAIAKLNFLPMSEFVKTYNSNSFIHTNFEFYYYKQPYIQSYSPKGSVVTGGTMVLVIGAWFQYKPDYGVQPYCKFGDKIVEGFYLSTVRITCKAPSYPKPNVRVKFGVSLNRHDFVYSDKLFTYYNDFTNAKFEQIFPQSGPDTGGTSVKIYGQNFTNLVTDTEFLCQFKPDKGGMSPKNVPAQLREYPQLNKTAIICNTPGGWTSGTRASILITFDGQNFMDTNFDFYFYKIEQIKPRSGPNMGNGPINIIGGGFINSTKVKCFLNKITYTPIKITESKIQCPMTPMNLNFTGYVDIGVTLNGIDPKEYPKGFYYYVQPVVNSIYPTTGPSKGNALVKVFGEGFRSDFHGAELGCKAGGAYGKGEWVSNEEMNCYFKRLPLLEMNSTLNFSIALNNYSFTEESANITFTPYGVISITPGSGPVTGGTRIQVEGAGFYEAKNARCRFGVPGYYYYTSAQYIDYNKIVCSSPEDFKVPQGGQLPFSVPFSIAFNDDEFNPWTESTHFFSFYETPSVISATPTEGKTTVSTMVAVRASLEMPFAMPSATVEEEDVLDYSNSIKGEIVSKKIFTYQPIGCRFGRFGVTPGIYVNRTLIKCITPNIKDDSDVGYEEVLIEIALNGVDYVDDDDVTFTFIGPNAGKMLWIYILITLFTAALLIVIASLAHSYWNKMMLQLQESNDVYSGDIPHVMNRNPRYLIGPENNQPIIPEQNMRNVMV